MPVYLQPGGTHFTLDFILRGQRHRRTSETATTKTLAKEELALWKRQVRDGLDTSKLKPMTLDEAATRYLQEVVMVKESNLQSTKDGVIHQIDQLTSFFGPDTQVTQITTDRIADFKTKKVVTDKRKIRTYLRLVGLLGSILSWCVKWRALTQAPAIERDKSKGGRNSVLERDDEPALLAACLEVDGQDLWDYAVCAIDSGGRKSCLLRLRKKHILARAKKTYFEKSKTDNARSVGWTRRVEEIMTRRLADKSTDRVFPWDENSGKRVVGQGTYRAPKGSPRGDEMRGIFPREVKKVMRYEVKLKIRGQLIYGGYFATSKAAAQARDALFMKHLGTDNNIQRPDVQAAFERAVEKAGLKGLVFHDLRHTFGTRLAQNGTPAKVIMQLMGHKDLKTTARYMHHAEDELQGAIDKLNQPDAAPVEAPAAPASPSASRKTQRRRLAVA